MKNSIDTIWDRTSDLPICSANLNHCATAAPLFVTYRGIIQSRCAQIPVARATKFYTVAHDVSMLRADFPAHARLCITPHVLSRKCPQE